MYIGSRRELLWTLRDRAERAEAEQALRVEQGRLNERARIAREMHDVLAHRISLIAMHAGALAYRTDLTAAETQQTAELIQATSHEALTDLRQVLGVLRDGDTQRAARAPAADLRGPVGARAARPRVPACGSSTTTASLGAAEMPDQVGRTAYRIVQEGLTNVRKHAPGVTRRGADERLAGRRASASGSATRRGSQRRLRTAAQPGAGLGWSGSGSGPSSPAAGSRRGASGGSFELTGWLPWKT